jgi:sugar/nucleoside kinase (ribokinase family)
VDGVYVLGNFTIDDIVYHGADVHWEQPGGNALYAALGAQVWLSNVGVLARLGEDYPSTHLDALRRRGLKLALRRVHAPNIHNWSLYEDDGARRFIDHLSSGSHHEMSIHAEELCAEDRQARAYHVAPMPTDIQLGLVRSLKRPGSLLTLDPHVDYINGHEPELNEILRIVDCFLPSREEARVAYGTDRPEEAARHFAASGPRAVVIKLGQDGSLVHDRSSGRMVHVPVVPVEVHDVTGAGDAYCGGFIAGMLATGDPVEAALYGTVSASYAVETRGAVAVPIPGREDATERLDALRATVRSGSR